MATRGVQFFMTPQEFSEFVSVDLAPLNLELIQVEGDGWSASDPRLSRTRYLAPRGGERPVTTRFDILHPAQQGWVSVNLPFVEGTTLYVADIGIKFQWFDPATETTTTNHELERLFGQIARRLRKKLKFPVVGFSLSTHKSAVYKSLGYSQGARAWLENSGEWRQEGSKNVGFKLP
jgi:hypothetical protein